MPKLFSAFKIGPYSLTHRVVHAPTTRLRAGPDDVPSDLMLEYYRQRASEGGLLIAESTHTSKDSRGYLGAPGIYKDAHIPGWKRIADAVHARGGLIFLQLGHDGRQSHVDLTGGKLPVAPSVVPFETNVLTHNGWVPASPHRAIDVDEIHLIVRNYRLAAERALEAGLDGIEIHSANGYLLDTFLQDGTNKRTDEYGGSLENRTRLLREVVTEVVDVFGEGRVGVRLSPSGQWGSISDSNPGATFSYAAKILNQFELAYLHVIEPRVKGTDTLDEHQAPVAAAQLRQFFNGPIIVAGGFNGTGAEEILARGDADLVAFGRDFTSNPDLPARLQNNWPLTPYERDAFWGGTHVHYSDFPAYLESGEQQAA